MQLFVVSNRSNTIYFANNKNQHFRFNADEQFLPVYQLADEKNKKITHLDSFTEKFLKKCTLGEMISKYMVLVESERKILVMRPYQIYAVKAIVDCIHQNRGNGYIWHTTGSGKTLTSFKASTLLKDNPDIEKCLFVVDRKDLDRQTREEFNKFQEGSVEENTNTETGRALQRDQTRIFPWTEWGRGIEDVSIERFWRMKGAIAILRFGPPEDGVSEIEVELKV